MGHSYRLLFLILLLAGPNLSTHANACGPDSDCVIDSRRYRIRMPDGHDGTSLVGAIIFNHGYRGTASGLMQNGALGRAVSDLGVAFIAPKSAGDDWDIPNAPFKGPRTELTFFDALKGELVANHFIDPDRIMVSGFSAGGMMTWNLACERGNEFAAFAPISGTFWAPIPQSCSQTPTNLIHVHGTEDPVVPLAGRRIQKTRQGNVYQALKLAVQNGKFGKWYSLGEFDGITCQERKSESGKVLQLCLHPGGHKFRAEWLIRSWKEFEMAGAFDK